MDGPKLMIWKSAETDSPGQASIFEDEDVTSTAVEAGDTSTGLSLWKVFPPEKIDLIKKTENVLKAYTIGGPIHTCIYSF